MEPGFLKIHEERCRIKCFSAAEVQISVFNLYPN